MEKYREIEKSIIKKYRKEIWSKFVKGVKDYDLIKNGDKIAVCISGGKDSFVLAKCMQELQRHGLIDFELEFIVMNPGYKEKNLKKIKENAFLLNIPITIFETDVFSVANKLNEKSPCYMCARMRRGYLYDKAKKLGCNKIALGHHSAVCGGRKQHPPLSGREPSEHPGGHGPGAGPIWRGRRSGLPKRDL